MPNRVFETEGVQTGAEEVHDRGAADSLRHKECGGRLGFRGNPLALQLQCERCEGIISLIDHHPEIEIIPQPFQPALF